jgi:hypothetical protein
MYLPPLVLAGLDGNSATPLASTASEGGSHMAAIFVSSSLSIAEQGERLREFIGRQNQSLSTEASENIARSLHLSKRAQAQTLARRLRHALSAHGIAISYQAALEALAKVCKDTSWMRMRQRSLPFEGASGDQRAFCLKIAPAIGEEPSFSMKQTLDAVATQLLGFVRSAWGRDAATPALCTLNIGPQAIAIDFEHPTKRWFTAQIWLASVCGETASMLDLPHPEVRHFVRRTQSELEHTHPGLLVLGAVRSETLPPWYHFLPTLRNGASGAVFTCSSELEIFTAFDTLQIRCSTDGSGAQTLASNEGPITLTANWASGVDGCECQELVPALQLRSIVQRTTRLRRITGRSLLQLFVHASTGADEATDFHQFDRTLFEAKRRELGLSITEVAARAGISNNSALRFQKYGWVHVSVLPKLAEMLNIKDPNELASHSDDRIGVRITSGSQFVQALQDTCYWRIILGDNLADDEKTRVAAIAEDLREYIDLLQFSRSPIFNKDHAHMDPLDPAVVDQSVQKLLDELSAMGIAAIIGREVYYATSDDDTERKSALPLPASALFLDKTSQLRRPSRPWAQAAA